MRRQPRKRCARCGRRTQHHLIRWMETKYYENSRDFTAIYRRVCWRCDRSLTATVRSEWYCKASIPFKVDPADIRRVFDSCTLGGV